MAPTFEKPSGDLRATFERPSSDLRATIERTSSNLGATVERPSSDLRAALLGLLGTSRARSRTFGASWVALVLPGPPLANLGTLWAHSRRLWELVERSPPGKALSKQKNNRQPGQANPPCLPAQARYDCQLAQPTRPVGQANQPRQVSTAKYLQHSASPCKLGCPTHTHQGRCAGQMSSNREHLQAR